VVVVTVRSSSVAEDRRAIYRRSPPTVRCFGNLLLLARSHLILSKMLMSDLAQIRTAEVKFVCNILPHKALSPSHQHLMTEAPPTKKRLRSEAQREALKKAILLSSKAVPTEIPEDKIAC
jgi:hypothetical protein